jgi:hypothetical protein
MKTTNLKLIAYSLAVLMLMQSCVVYHKTPVSVDEAVASNNMVKIYTTENKIHKFEKLVTEDGKIYGIKSIRQMSFDLNKKLYTTYIKEIDQDKGLVKILFPFEIEEVYTKNKTMSNLATVVMVFSPLIIMAILIGLWVAAGSPVDITS